jgi:hypothetical protein
MQHTTTPRGEVKKLGSIQGVLPPGGGLGVAQEMGREGGGALLCEANTAKKKKILYQT